MSVVFRRIEHPNEWDAIVDELRARIKNYNITWRSAVRQDRWGKWVPNVIDVVATYMNGHMYFGMRYYPGNSFETQDYYVFDLDDYIKQFEEWRNEFPHGTSVLKQGAE